MEFDALIITALYDELMAILEITDDVEIPWIEERDPDGFLYHHRNFKTSMDEPLCVAAAWSGNMGETAAANRSRSLISHLRPLCLGMSGICAGRRKDVFLGDVIVADRVFSYDHGKLIETIDKRAGKAEKFLHDIETYNLEKVWAMDAKYFSSKKSWCNKFIKERPISMDFQRLWLLRRLFQHEMEGAPSPVSLPDRKDRCPKWTEVINALKKDRFIKIQKSNASLTAKGKNYISKNLILHPDEQPNDPPFQVHVGPIGTGKAVREDPQIFDRIAKFERKVIGLEMEAAAIGYVAETVGIPSIVVKGVSDYADENKDDSFRAFASKASANFLIDFLRNHPPKSRLKQRYHFLLSATEESTAKIISDRTAAKISDSLPHNIPPKNTVAFVGRTEELENLHQQFLKNDLIAITTIHGMGGVGKTELAIQFAVIHLHLLTYPGGILWLDARQENVGSQIIEFAQNCFDLNPPQNVDLLAKVKFCWARWPKGKVLVVLDDVNDYSTVEPYLPPQPSRFKVLITTRLQLDLPKLLPLDVLREEFALTLLQEWVGQERISKELANAKKLCQWVGYLPLALQLVGRYLKKRNLNFAEMLERLTEKGLKHKSLDVDKKELSWTLRVKRGVFAAFMLSWEELSNEAKQLGCLLSLFALAPIPWDLVKKVFLEEDFEKFEDGCIELLSFNLLQGNNPYNLHQLVREFFREMISQLDQADQIKKAFASAMAKEAKRFSEISGKELEYSISFFIPHLSETATHLNNYLDDNEYIWPPYLVGRINERLGLFFKAEYWYKKCIEIAQNRPKVDHLAFAACFSNLGNLYRTMARYEDAEPLLKRALEISEKHLGSNHPQICPTLNNLAVLYKNQGKYEDAEQLFEQALAIVENTQEPDLFFIAHILNELGEVYGEQGNYKKAEPLFRRALKIFEDFVKPDSLLIANVLTNLGASYYLTKKHKKAKPLLERALKIKESFWGMDHHEVAFVLNHMANLSKSQRKYRKAKSLFRRALDISENTLGPNHPRVAYCLYGLAAIYNEQHRYNEAEQLFQRALTILENALGSNHPHTIMTKINLSSVKPK